MNSPDSAAPPLWQQLQSASSTLALVMQGQSLSEALERVSSRLRPGVQALSFDALRHWGLSRALRDQLVHRKPAPALDALLCLSLAILLSSTQAYDAHTLVNQAVEAAKRTPGLSKSADFLNACLRRYLRESEALLEQAQRLRLEAVQCPAVWNYPAWWVKRLRNDYPQSWQAVLQAGLDKAPLSLRVHAALGTVPDYLKALQLEGISAYAVGDQASLAAPQAVIVDQAVHVQRLPGFAQGQVSVQDVAAQWAAPGLMNAFLSHARRTNGETFSNTSNSSALRVLDACAAPGGKTAHLLEWALAHQQGMALTALEIEPKRCERIHENLKRLNLPGAANAVQVLQADASKVTEWWDGQLFDAVLLDAPCSASGIVRRHPDIAWLRRETDIAQLAQIQDDLLNALWPLLKSLGYLLYCTCSVFKAEGQDRVQAFLKRNTSARLCASPGHLLPTSARLSPQILDNQPLNHDGFYYALLQKN
jgi:16S rRNA (cytosine967-C5)-methyltransferase